MLHFYLRVVHVPHCGKQDGCESDWMMVGVIHKDIKKPTLNIVKVISKVTCQTFDRLSKCRTLTTSGCCFQMPVSICALILNMWTAQKVSVLKINSKTIFYQFLKIWIIRFSNGIRKVRFTGFGSFFLFVYLQKLDDFRKNTLWMWNLRSAYEIIIQELCTHINYINQHSLE